jgi:hypothetical protein
MVLIIRRSSTDFTDHTGILECWDFLLTQRILKKPYQVKEDKYMWLLLVIGAIAVFCEFCSDSNSCNSSDYEDETDDSNRTRFYSDGSWSTKCLGDTWYSTGERSHTDYWGREVIDNGNKIIDQNGVIWNKSGKKIGYEWTDIFGIVHRDIQE